MGRWRQALPVPPCRAPALRHTPHAALRTAGRPACCLPCCAGAPSQLQQQQRQRAQRALGEAEVCMARALQLNPKRAGAWAALGRLYAVHGEGARGLQISEFESRPSDFENANAGTRACGAWVKACGSCVSCLRCVLVAHGWPYPKITPPLDARAPAPCPFASPGALAQWCFEQCRSHDPTLVAVWEGMAHLAGSQCKVGVA